MSSATFTSNFLQTGCLRKDGLSNSNDKKRNAGKVFVKCSANTKTPKAEKEVRLGVLGASGYTGSEGLARCSKVGVFGENGKPLGLSQSYRGKILCAMNMTAGQSDDSGKMKLDQLIDRARQLWESSPQPVKNFPWKRAVQNFVQLILDLILAVVKYLCVPLLAVSSLSEMSYCAHAKKLPLVPIPVLIGMAIAQVFERAALDVSPLLKNAEVPWHLIVMAIFFTLLKLPGPYYPFWGRIFIPHIANGGLLRTLWFAFFWYRRPQVALRTAPSQQHSESGSQSDNL